MLHEGVIQVQDDDTGDCGDDDPLGATFDQQLTATDHEGGPRARWVFVELGIQNATRDRLLKLSDQGAEAVGQGRT